MKTTHRIILMALFAIWFGGFTFYTAIVVPIGTDVLGSSRTQGFVTQQVTNRLNVIGAIALLWMLLGLVLLVRQNGIKRLLKSLLVFAVIAVSWGVLLVLHPMLDQLVEPDNDYVADEERFYFLHRIYLWTSTIQWLFCWVWLSLTIRDWTDTPKQTATS